MKRRYGQRVREVERGVFTPLVLSTNGGMGKEAVMFYRCLADLIAQKSGHGMAQVPALIRIHAILYHPVYMDNISLASQEGHVPPLDV